jgi:hypothetical protein
MDGLKKRILTCRTSRLTNLRRAVLAEAGPERFTVLEAGRIETGLAKPK